MRRSGDIVETSQMPALCWRATLRSILWFLVNWYKEIVTHLQRELEILLFSTKRTPWEIHLLLGKFIFYLCIILHESRKVQSARLTVSFSLSFFWLLLCPHFQNFFEILISKPFKVFIIVVTYICVYKFINTAFLLPWLCVWDWLLGIG